jgi:hypothetical protein
MVVRVSYNFCVHTVLFCVCTVLFCVRTVLFCVCTMLFCVRNVLFCKEPFSYVYTRWFKYDRDWFSLNQTESVPVIFEPPCIYLPPFAATKFNKISLGWQLLEVIRVNWCFRDCRSHNQIQFETELISEMLVNLDDLMQLLSWEDVIEAMIYFMWSVAYYTHILQGAYCKFVWVNKLPCYKSVCFKHLLVYYI